MHERNTVVFANDQDLLWLNLTHNQIIERCAPGMAVDTDPFRNLIWQNAKSKDGASSLTKIAIDEKENYFSKESISINYKPTGEKNSIYWPGDSS